MVAVRAGLATGPRILSTFEIKNITTGKINTVKTVFFPKKDCINDLNQESGLDDEEGCLKT